MLRMCFDKRVVGGLALVGVGVLVFAPNLFTAALPLLFVVMCPLSMLLMAKTAMKVGTRTPISQDAHSESVIPIADSKPGDMMTSESGSCPTCGAALGMGHSPNRLSLQQRQTTASEHHSPG